MSNDCQRFEAIALARAEGIEPSSEEQRFEEAHLDECEACRRLAGAGALMRDSLDGPEEPADELARRRELDALLELAERMPVAELTGQGAPVPARRLALIGLAVAAGLALAFWLGAAGVGGAPESGLSAAPEIGFDQGARVITALGDVRVDGGSLVDGQRVTPGQVLESGAGRLALRLDERVTLMLGEQARIRAEALGGRETRVALERGQLMAAVAPLAAGQRFVVATRFGRVQVVGTVFSVSVGPDSAEVRVTEGEVQLFEPGQPSRALKPGDAAVLGRAGVAVAAVPDGEAAARQGQGSGMPGVAAASAPPAAVPRPRAVAAAAVPGDVPESPAAVVEQPVPAARELLDLARKLRLQREWFGAAAAYAELIERHPQSQEGGAALVALGQIQLEHLESPVQALESFEAYLARGEDALAPEAAFGRAGALRVLLRRDDERAALEAFLEQYPKAAQASQVRRRLGTLGDE